VLFWPLIDANISDQLPEFHKMACKAYRYDFAEKKCRYGFQAATEVQVCHTGPSGPCVWQMAFMVLTN